MYPFEKCASPPVSPGETAGQQLTSSAITKTGKALWQKWYVLLDLLPFFFDPGKPGPIEIVPGIPLEKFNDMVYFQPWPAHFRASADYLLRVLLGAVQSQGRRKLHQLDAIE